MKLLFFFLITFSLVGCGSKKSPSDSESIQKGKEEIKPKPRPKPKPKPKPHPGDTEPKPTPLPEIPELKSLFEIAPAIAREVKGMNFGSKESPIWGKEEWVVYHKPWQKDAENWYARVKLNPPEDLELSQPSAFLVWCHYHGKKMYCHKSSNSTLDEIGKEPLDPDFPEDQPKSEEEECNDPTSCDDIF